jgi:hypothetical protein
VRQLLQIRPLRGHRGFSDSGAEVFELSSEEKPPRVAVSKGLTLPLGNYASSRVDYRIEADVPAGVSAAQALDDLEATVDKKLEAHRLQFKPATEAPTVPAPPPNRASSHESPADEPGSSGGTADVPELDASFLDTLPWKPYASGKGEWVFANTDGAAVLREELSHADKKTLTIGKNRYRLSGTDDKFIGRTPVQ